ncbi:hypothetical protein NW765_014875 [Fusarium oxysporum]|nr:hypothetical protein NW765_014875 [Fusarium oxysporum]
MVGSNSPSFSSSSERISHQLVKFKHINVAIMLILSPSFMLGAAALLVITHIIIRLTSATAKVPGPFVSNFTSLVLKWHELNANRTMYIHELHKRYGPVVRVAPNEVSFTSIDALKEIYGSGGSGYDKTEFYDLFQVYGKRTMFSTLVKGDHAKRRRMIGDRYANSNVMKQAPWPGYKNAPRGLLSVVLTHLTRRQTYL